MLMLDITACGRGHSHSSHGGSKISRPQRNKQQVLTLRVQLATINRNFLLMEINVMMFQSRGANFFSQRFHVWEWIVMFPPNYSFTIWAWWILTQSFWNGHDVSFMHVYDSCHYRSIMTFWMQIWHCLRCLYINQYIITCQCLCHDNLTLLRQPTPLFQEYNCGG